MQMTEELFEQVAERFRVLGEPARLRILDTLRAGEASVGELVGRTGLNQANLSKHLQILHAMGFVVRRKEGLFVYYGLADEDVFLLCDVMCGRIERVAASVPARRPRAGTRRRAG